jgi:ribonuclease E
MTDENKDVKEEKTVKAKTTAKKTTRKKAAPKKKTAAKSKTAKTAKAADAKKAPAKKTAPKKKTAAQSKTAKKKTSETKKTTRKPAVKKKATPKKKTAVKPEEEKTASPKKAPAKKSGATKEKTETAPEKPVRKTRSTPKKAKQNKEAEPKSAPETETASQENGSSSSEKTTAGEKAESAEKKDNSAKEKKSAKKTKQAQNNKKPSAKKKSTTRETQKKADPAATYRLLVNAEEPEECRIALLENGKVQSFNVETVVRAQTKGNIYKGIITAVEPNLQAAFVDMGTGKNGFLPFSDIHPEYYCKDVGKKKHWKDLSIQSVIMKGQEVLVEVVKETTGNKGANLTTYLSMPGRYVVLMPGSDSHGISRKINNEDRRTKLREIIKSAKLPEEIGYIIRTASEDITKTALMKDIRFQLNLWKEIKHNGQTMKAPAIVYKEQNIVSRFLRDHFTPEINEIMVDNKDVFDKITAFMELLPAKQRTTKVKLHRGSKPIFNQFQVEEQIEQMYQPQVPLPSGGSIVIDPTEALVAIDVNSGRTSKDKNFEKTIFLANMEAADELARQLRLRDLGGLIVVDFIDMRDKRNIREVEKKLRSSLKKDKAKIDTSRISKFGLMQISRQRLGPPIQKGNYIKCEHCQGSGIIKSVETTSLSLLRRIQTGAAKRHIVAIECELPLAIAQYLLNQKRADIVDMEKKYRVEIRVISNPAMTPAQEEIRFVKKES